MNTTMCRTNKIWKELPFNECIPANHKNLCQTICPPINELICATDGTTYRIESSEINAKWMRKNRNKDWKERPLNECTAKGHKKRSTSCPAMCPMVYGPVCATDGTTSKIFGNQCEMNVANCQANRWRATRSNDCVQ
ncbi:unnamed protein product [Hermetia illucens]|uniref:Kazal-like domain-containing protein n=1 Tax=Hermetia illucens TaxID=343691 RepID=A0A7R8UQS4_HERIL|nr:unnamed protein product [Hermetia illucens]